MLTIGRRIQGSWPDLIPIVESWRAWAWCSRSNLRTQDRASNLGYSYNTKVHAST